MYEQGSFFLYILTNTCCCLSFWWKPLWHMVDISCWFWFMFPWWLAMLSIFACTCWPYVCLLWTNVYSSHQPVLRVLFLVQFFLIWTNSYILLHLAHFCSELVFWFKVFFSYHQVTVWVCVCSVASDSLWSHGLKPARLLYSWNFPGKNTGPSCQFSLQGIFLT